MRDHVELDSDGAIGILGLSPGDDDDPAPPIGASWDLFDFANPAT